MARHSDDPYGDFVVRVMNAARVARNQSNGMSDDELATIEAVRDCLIANDPAAVHCPRGNIIIRVWDNDKRSVIEP